MKKTLILSGVLIGIIASAFFLWPSQKQPLAESAAPVSVINEYPEMTFVMTDGSKQSARDLPEKSILIVYFPDCDHCQREAIEISNHLKEFQQYNLWFISIADYAEIEKFANEYKLRGNPNIHFVRTEMLDVVKCFGAISTPSIYIYSKDKKLVKSFNGETQIQEIIKYL